MAFKASPLFFIQMNLRKHKTSLVSVFTLIFLSAFCHKIINSKSFPNVQPFQPKPRSLTKALNEFEQEQKKEPGGSQQQSVSITLKTELVVERFSVVDRTGQLIAGLKSNDFIIREDAIEQKPESFTALTDTVRPIRYILVMDASRSVFRYFAAGMRGINYFIEQLKNNESLSIVDDNLRILSSYSGSKESLKEGVKKHNKAVTLSIDEQISRLTGRSHQIDALVASLIELADEEGEQQVLILQSDADQYPCLKGQPCGPNAFFGASRDTRYTAEAVLELARKKNVRLYSVIQATKLSELSESEAYEVIFKERINTDSTWVIKKLAIKNAKRNNQWGCYILTEKWMTELAETTGGWAAFMNQPDSAENIYARILAESRQSYSLSYYPTNTARDGKWREIKITVKDHPEYIVRGRKGYYAARD